jgi:uncharacterized protein (DUF2249 family)
VLPKPIRQEKGHSKIKAISFSYHVNGHHLLRVSRNRDGEGSESG